jgi:hypothetical protein
MMLLSKTTNARKKRGRCQIWRDRPVRSRIATTTHAARKPITETTKIQGIKRSKILNSGRFAPPKVCRYWATAAKLAEFVCCDNDLPRERENLERRRYLER